MKSNNSIIKIVFFSLFLVTCKESRNRDKGSFEKKDSIQLISEKKGDNKNTTGHIENFRGIWRSFSLYLEHESEFKDYNEKEYYQVIDSNKVLLITIGRSTEDEFSISKGYIGFLNTKEKKLKSIENFRERFKGSGKILTRCISNSKEYECDIIEYSENYERYFEVSEIFNDGFGYGKKSENISFRKLSSLPVNVFKKIKELDVNEATDLIKNYSLKELSSKIKVITEKTFFYNEMSKDTKRKAFLVKNDTAYLVEIDGEWAKVYYDGKIVSDGYVMLSDVEILN